VHEGGGGAALEKPIVIIRAGCRSEAIDEAEKHLVEHDPDLFERNGVVRVAPEDVDVGGGEKASALRIVRVGVEHMRERFTRAVCFQVADKRSRELVAKDTPRDLAAAYLERDGERKLPLLHAVATAPTMRPDGSIIDKPGFDRASGVYYDPRGVAFPAVPLAPTRALAREALDRLLELIGSCDFVDEASRSTALFGMFTAVVRTALDVAPLHAFTAPVAGSGKSMLVDLASIMANGHRTPVMALGQRDDELEKALKGALLGGDVLGCIDNCERPLGGDLLSQICTQSLVNVRPFQTLTNQRVVNRIALFATGNNLQLVGDVTRRALVGGLDPQCERPGLREFETENPCVIAMRERSALVVAILSIVRAFVLAGCPQETAALGSYESWSRWVRDPLIWLGCTDPALTMEAARGSDPRLSALKTILAQWSAQLGDARVTAQQVIAAAGETALQGFRCPEFRDALLVVASERGAINSRRFGKWLAASAGRRVTVDIDGRPSARVLCRDGERFGVALWRVTPCWPAAMRVLRV
jgi:hypothetical protein